MIQATVHLLAGDGIVVPLDGGIVVLGPDCPADAPQHLATLLDGLEGASFTGAIATMTSSWTPRAAVAGGETVWSLLAAPGMQVRTEYEDRISTREGPLHVTQRDPLVITVAPVGSAETGTEGPPLRDQPVGGAGGIQLRTPLEQEMRQRQGRGVLVQGVACACGTLVAPNALGCPSCGADLLEERNLTTGIRPSLGELVVDNGVSYPLEVGYVLGREAQDSPEVSSGRAVALELRDVGRSLSRVHTTFSLRDWDVLITDEASGNGTLVRPIDGWRWQRLDPGVAYRLLPGSEVRVGNHLLRFVAPKPPVAT